MKRVLKIILVIACIFAIGFVALFLLSKNKSSETSEKNRSLGDDRASLDLDGDGVDEYISYELPDSEDDYNLKSLTAYNHSEEEIARLPSELSIKAPMSESVKIYRLDANSPREYFSFDFIAGPHQSETMFFELRDDLILPVCHEDEVSGPYDCLFYSGNTGYLPVKDLDGDGFAELIETVDEYPGTEGLDSEETNAVEQAFGDQGLEDITDEAKTVAEREKGGRGRMVVWSVYSFDGTRFVLQTDDNYEKYYDLIGDLVENKMRKSELSEDSLEYIQLSKDFWSHTN